MPRSVGPTAASSPRLLVLEVSHDVRGLVLRTVDAVTNAPVRVALHDAWAGSDPTPGELVRVVLVDAQGVYQRWEDTAGAAGAVFVNNSSNLFVRHPDALVAGTSVADSFVCMRKAVLSARVPGGIGGSSGTAALFGSMIHDLFQRCLVMASRSVPEEGTDGTAVLSLGAMDVLAAVEDVLQKHAEDLYGCSVNQNRARTVLHNALPLILDWQQGFLGENAGGVEVRERKNVHRVTVPAIHDIEELIWSPVLGLKGKIDASVQFTTEDQARAVGALELKTGSSTGYSAVSHHAQVTLYSLLMSDRYDESIDLGMISYVPCQDPARVQGGGEGHASGVSGNGGTLNTKNNSGSRASDSGAHSKLVKTCRSELVGLVMQRNELASFLRVGAEVQKLPPVLEDREGMCAKCFANDSCMIQHRMFENGSADSASVGPGAALFEQKAGHLDAAHVAYYRFWRQLLSAEEAHDGMRQKEIWTLTGAEREAEGRCLSDLRLLVDESVEDGNSNVHHLLAPGEQILQAFSRHDTAGLGPLNKVGVSAGDYIVVSAASVISDAISEPSRVGGSTRTWQPALTNGFVQSVSAQRVVVRVDRSLAAWARHQSISVDDIAWRIDSQEILASHRTAKVTLEMLFAADESGGSSRIRNLVVSLAPPQFSSLSTAEAQKHTELENYVRTSGLQLNADQLRALRMSHEARDYTLILGMPGTGKTATLAAIVVVAALSGKSVLLCSHTHAAVDNVLARLLDLGFKDFIRLSRSLSMLDPRIHPYHASIREDGGISASELEAQLSRCAVVATTCLGINHPLFTRRQSFDLVVLDEASQILQPICLGPLRYACGSFVLVGDHYQLPPLLRARKAPGNSTMMNSGSDIGSVSRSELSQDAGSSAVDGSNDSLFRRLCEAHPGAAVSLTKQYRMAADIMSLSNDLVYSGSLSCGSADVARQRLDLPIGGVRSLPTWLKGVRNPVRRLIFLDTGGLSGDSTDGPSAPNCVAPVAADPVQPHQQASRKNVVEMQVILASIHSLVGAGLSPSDVVILSPFRAQVNHARHVLRNSETESGVNLAAVGAFTIDQYQGKDSCCVFVSFVRCNESHHVGPLLRDWRRINVAMTRAKQKLVLVGSAKTLAGSGNFLSTMLKSLAERQLVLPVDGLPQIQGT